MSVLSRRGKKEGRLKDLAGVSAGTVSRALGYVNCCGPVHCRCVRARVWRAEQENSMIYKV